MRLSLLLFVFAALAAVGTARVAHVRRQDAQCDMCRQVEARAHQLMNSQPSEVSAADLCGGEITPDCNAFLITYGRTIVYRAYYGQTDICGKLVSQKAYLMGRLQPVCAVEDVQTEPSDTVQQQQDGGDAPTAVEVKAPDVAPKPAPCSTAAMTPLHTYIRVMIAMRQQQTSSSAALSQSGGGDVADAVIQRTDYLANQKGEVWRATQDVHLTLNRQGEVTSSLRVVNMQQISAVQGPAAETANMDGTAKTLERSSGFLSSPSFDQATLIHVVAIFAAILIISAIVLLLSGSSRDENASDEEEVDALIEVMSQPPSTMTHMRTFVPTMSSAPLAKEKEPMDF